MQGKQDACLLLVKIWVQGWYIHRVVKDGLLRAVLVPLIWFGRLRNGAVTVSGVLPRGCTVVYGAGVSSTVYTPWVYIVLLFFLLFLFYIAGLIVILFVGSSEHYMHV